MALTLALPAMGRTLPLYLKVVSKSMAENEMTNLETEVLTKFFIDLDEQTRLRLVVLADRGFAKVELFKLINSYKAVFVIRVPRTAHVNISGTWIDLSNLQINSYEGAVYNDVIYSKEHSYTLNLVVRKAKPEKANNPEDDCWILATNKGYKANDACSRYSKRMKIEEMFKDMKSSGFNIEDTSYSDEDSMQKLMLVLAISYIVLLEWHALYGSPETEKLVTRNHKGRGTLEHSAFQIALRVFDLAISLSGFTKEELQFLSSYLLIRSRYKNRIILPLVANLV